MQTKNALLIVVLSALTFSFTAQAQSLSKEDKRAYRQKAKELKSDFKENVEHDVEKFAQFKEKNSSVLAKADSLEQVLAKLRSQDAAMDQQLASLKKEAKETDSKIAYLKQLAQETKEKGIPAKGSYYAVHLLEADQESQEDAVVVGIYNDRFQAIEMKEQVLAMGMEAASVVAYRDGEVISKDISKDTMAATLSQK